MNIQVETYSGSKADEYPKRLYTGETVLEVIEVEDRWYEPDSTYFRVFTDNCCHYVLKHISRCDVWKIIKVQKNG
ncbi:MAG: hypothetical protein GF350_11775 [Chitinivibrionales bacterium]|nr:hypothetical protein [Chitinivibrionales bacterium]